MNAETANVRDKIRALLAKATSTEHEGEADLYLKKAEELMERHQIALFEVGISDPIGFTKAADFYQAGPPSYRSMVHNALARYYGCEVIKWNAMERIKGKRRFGWNLEMCGSESSRLTTELMMPFVWQQVNKQAKLVVERSYGMVNQATAVRDVAKALTVRIFDEVRKRKASVVQPEEGTCHSLVVIDQIAALMKREYPDLKEGKETTVSLSRLAKDAAAGIAINHQVGHKKALRLEDKQ